MVLIPAGVWYWCRLDRATVLNISGLRKTTCLPGIITGAFFAGVIILLYELVFKNLIEPEPLIDKIKSLGIIRYYWFMAVFLSLGNSLMEEYYWRSFLYGEFIQKISSLNSVCLITGAIFGLHHIFPLLQYFPLHFALLFTFGTMVAGASWAFLRTRGYSIIDCYVCHILADLAIFYAGWRIIKSAL